MFSGKGGAQGRSDLSACFQTLGVVQPGRVTHGNPPHPVGLLSNLSGDLPEGNRTPDLCSAIAVAGTLDEENRALAVGWMPEHGENLRQFTDPKRTQSPRIESEIERLGGGA